LTFFLYTQDFGGKLYHYPAAVSLDFPGLRH